MVNDTPISVSRVRWSPDGNFVGVFLFDRLLTFEFASISLIAFLVCRGCIFQTLNSLVCLSWIKGSNPALRG